MEKCSVAMHYVQLLKLQGDPKQNWLIQMAISNSEKGAFFESVTMKILNLKISLCQLATLTVYKKKAVSFSL